MKLATVVVALFAASAAFASSSQRHDSTVVQRRLTERQSVDTASCAQEDIAARLPLDCGAKLYASCSSDIGRSFSINNTTLEALGNSSCFDSIAEVTRGCPMSDNFVYFDSVNGDGSQVFCDCNRRRERCAWLVDTIRELFDLITVNCFVDGVIPPFCRESCNQTTFSKLIFELDCCVNRLATIPSLDSTGNVVPHITPLVQCGVNFPTLCSAAAVMHFSVLSIVMPLVAAVLF